jgi:hypothetical protein
MQIDIATTLWTSSVKVVLIPWSVEPSASLWVGLGTSLPADLVIVDGRQDATEGRTEHCCNHSLGYPPPALLLS